MWDLRVCGGWRGGRRLRALDALAEGRGLIASIHVAALSSSSRSSDSFSPPQTPGTHVVHIHVGKITIHVCFKEIERVCCGGAVIENKEEVICHAWWRSPAIPALRSLRREDQEFKASPKGALSRPDSSVDFLTMYSLWSPVGSSLGPFLSPCFMLTASDSSPPSKALGLGWTKFMCRARKQTGWFSATSLAVPGKAGDFSGQLLHKHFFSVYIFKLWYIS